MPRLNPYPRSAAAASCRWRMSRDEPRTAVLPCAGCSGSRRTRGFHGQLEPPGEVGRADSSSSLMSCGSPSSAAPVNSSDPPIMLSRWSIGTNLPFELPCMSTKLAIAYRTPAARSCCFTASTSSLGRWWSWSSSGRPLISMAYRNCAGTSCRRGPHCCRLVNRGSVSDDLPMGNDGVGQRVGRPRRSGVQGESPREEIVGAAARLFAAAGTRRPRSVAIARKPDWGSPPCTTGSRTRKRSCRR